jgi:hypothetical protein
MSLRGAVATGPQLTRRNVRVSPTLGNGARGLTDEVSRASQVVAISAVVFGCLAWPVVANADTQVTARVTVIRPTSGQMNCQLTFRSICLRPSAGNDAVVEVLVPRHFASISTVCLTFHFTGDLFAAGDELAFLGGVGFISTGPTSLNERTSSLDGNSQVEDTALFLDGHQTVNVWMESGSVFRLSTSS